MGKKLIAGLAVAALAGAGQAQVVTEWALLGEPGDQAFTPASSSAAGVTGLAMTRGAGINPTAANDTFSGSGWNTLTSDDYFSIGFTVDPGYLVDLEQLWIGTRSSNTGPGSLGLYHSGDGFSTNIHTFVQSGSTVSNSVVDLSALGGLTGTVELRVMSLDNISAGGGTVGSAGTFRFSEHAAGGTSTPVRLTGQVSPLPPFATPFCLGDGSGIPCPCGNTGGPGQGCANGTGTGATLEATGSASVSAADLVLSARGLAAGTSGLYFQGSAQVNGGNGVAFGDGLRCVGIDIVRLQHVLAGGSGESSTSLDLVALGGVSPGDTRYYQLWYHEEASISMCGSGFNLTQGLEITWAP